MPIDDPQNFKAQLRAQRKKVKELDCDDDIDAVEDYIKRVKNKQTSTLINHISCLRILSEHAEKPLLDHNGIEMDELIIDISNERGWSDGTQRNYEKSARQFYRHFGRNADADEIEFTKTEQKKIKKEDTLSAEEIKELLTECARMDRDRAMIYLLYETGARLSAVLSLRVKDVRFGEGPGGSTLIKFNEEAKGLKGAHDHEVIVKPSEVFLENYINREHPDPENPDAPFFCVTRDHYEPEGDNSLIPSFFRRRLKRLVADSDIPEEKANPHNFRHSRVTQMRLEGYSDRQIADHMNWGPNSEQFDIYDHTDDEDRHAEMAKKMGLEVEDTELREPMLDNCPRCNYTIDDWLQWSQCPRCQAQLKFYKEPHWLEYSIEILGPDDPVIQHLREHPHLIYDDYDMLPESVREEMENAMYEDSVRLETDIARGLTDEEWATDVVLPMYE